MQQSKRKISILIPIKSSENELSVFLQKRSADMKSLPNYFGFWGGHAEENEMSEETLMREIQEEMGIILDMTKVRYFNHYEFLRNTKDVYLIEVEDGWENQIMIGEGDYGKWFLTGEALEKPDIIFEDKVVINDMERVLLKKPIR